jgi:hypothetical protein
VFGNRDSLRKASRAPLRRRAGRRRSGGFILEDSGYLSAKPTSEPSSINASPR